MVDLRSDKGQIKKNIYNQCIEMLRFFEPASQDYYNNLTRTLGGPNSRTELHNL